MSTSVQRQVSDAPTVDCILQFIRINTVYICTEQQRI